MKALFLRKKKACFASEPNILGSIGQYLHAWVYIVGMSQRSEKTQFNPRYIGIRRDVTTSPHSAEPAMALHLLGSMHQYTVSDPVIFLKSAVRDSVGGADDLVHTLHCAKFHPSIYSCTSTTTTVHRRLDQTMIADRILQ
jgi:hypothetical protein